MPQRGLTPRRSRGPVLDENSRQLEIFTLDAVKAIEVDWLWERHIPYGNMTLLTGDGAVGKTFVSMAIAAAVTEGRRLPGDKRAKVAPGDVLMVNYEDGNSERAIAQAIKKRADSLDMDQSRVRFITGEKDADGKRAPFGRGSMSLLEKALDKFPKTRLVVIDPIMAYVGGGADVNRDNEIREALESLVELAARKGFALLIIAHHRKASAERAAEKVAGSVAFVNLPRSVIQCAWDKIKDADGNVIGQRRLLMVSKHNLCGDSKALEYEIDAEGRFAWGPEVDVKADDVIGTPSEVGGAGRKQRPERLREAKEFLQSYLTDQPQTSKNMYEEINKRGLTFNKKVMAEARKSVGVKSEQKDGKWFVSIPPEWDGPTF